MTPTSHHITVNNLRIHYTEAGSGPPILLIHGFPTSSHLWRNVMPELAKTHRAIAIDLPGYGLSDKPVDAKYDFEFYEEVLNDLLDALGIEETALAVHDLGGPIGLFWAVRHAERVKQLVLLNTLVYPETSWAVKLFLIALRTPGVRDYLVSPKGIVGAMKFGVVHKDRLNREVLTPYTAPFEDAAARQALIKAGSGLGIKGLAEIARKLPTLEASVRIIYGENDRALPDVAKTMQRVKRDLPGAEVTSLSNCGHFLQEDEPERLGQLMAEFLNRPNPAQQPAADLVRAFNGWAENDLDITPAAVTHCSRQSLPDDPRELMRLIPEVHRTFFDQAAGPDFETLDFTTPTRNLQTFDPTADILPPPEDSPAGQQAQSKATAYFNSRPIHLVQATGTDTAGDLNITLLIALDPQSSQLFTFITALSD
jgi:haloalkane dehalogenase